MNREGTTPLSVTIPAGSARVAGYLAVPAGAAGLVLFAHGTGSGRDSPRNRFVATALAGAGLGTLLIDLLTREEEAAERTTGHLRFDIGLLSQRLLTVTDWLLVQRETQPLPLGYFGASTGAAAALAAASGKPETVRAIVSRGGRPDLAPAAVLRAVRAPTLLIVGGHDHQVLELNRRALDLLAAPKALHVVPDASHLFEEPGTLEDVAALAAQWFLRHLPSSTSGARRS
jgi:putative phosphoribosyl transferase